MTDWDYAPYDRYNRQLKHYDKKHKNELVAILENLGKYTRALRVTGSPQHITGKYIHKEPMGIKGIDESGERKIKNLQTTRLYVYPEVETKTLHLLIIGPKKTQPKDIKFCKEIVKQIRSESNG